MHRTLRNRIILTLFWGVTVYSAWWFGVQLAKANVYVWTIAA